MKSCPTCQRFYDDDITFCLEDGATLHFVSDVGSAAQPVTAPIRGPRPTAPAATEIFATPQTAPPMHPSVPVAKSTAGRALGVMALLAALLSVVLMIAGFAGVAAKLQNEIVGLLIVSTMFISLFGAALGLVGVLRAVRNGAGKAWPLLGLLANALYLIFILLLLVLGIATS
jgi:hypothetical protein